MVQKNEQYDAILLSNLMCRLSAPAQCLQQFTESDHYLKSGGILVISSPNTWMAQYTDPANFLMVQTVPKRLLLLVSACPDSNCCMKRICPS